MNNIVVRAHDKAANWARVHMVNVLMFVASECWQTGLPHRDKRHAQNK